METIGVGGVIVFYFCLIVLVNTPVSTHIINKITYDCSIKNLVSISCMLYFEPLGEYLAYCFYTSSLLFYLVRFIVYLYKEKTILWFYLIILIAVFTSMILETKYSEFLQLADKW